MKGIVALALGALLLPASLQAQAMAARAGQGTEFTVTVENISTAATLQLSNGTTAPAPTAPVLYLVHSRANPVFTDGRPDRGLGLENLAEQGDPSELVRALARVRGVVSAAFINLPAGDAAPGPLTPGKSYRFSFTAEPGQRLTLAMMFAQSNDLFFAPGGEGIALFDRAGRPLEGDITSTLVLWDAGTEVNQEPGLGPDQAPRQARPNTGATERGTVRIVNDQFRYPATGEVLRVTIQPSGPAGGMSSGM